MRVATGDMFSVVTAGIPVECLDGDYDAIYVKLVGLVVLPTILAAIVA